MHKKYREIINEIGLKLDGVARLHGCSIHTVASRNIGRANIPREDMDQLKELFTEYERIRRK